MPKPARLDRAALVQTALQMVDEGGLEALTLRRLAAAAGVQAASLYWHFKDKQEIISELAQALLAGLEDALPPPANPEAWAPWLEGMGLALRGAMLACRDGARIVAGADLGRAPALGDLWEQGIGVLTAAGFELLPATQLVITLSSYTFGFVIEEQSAPQGEGPEDREGAEARFPLTASAMPLYTAAGPDANFVAGLRLILRGAQAPA